MQRKDTTPVMSWRNKSKKTLTLLDGRKVKGLSEFEAIEILVPSGFRDLVEIIPSIDGKKVPKTLVPEVKTEELGGETILPPENNKPEEEEKENKIPEVKNTKAYSKHIGGGWYVVFDTTTDEALSGNLRKVKAEAMLTELNPK